MQEILSSTVREHYENLDEANLDVQILAFSHAVPAWRHRYGTLDLRYAFTPGQSRYSRPSLIIVVSLSLTDRPCSIGLCLHHRCCKRYFFAEPILSLWADKSVDVLAVIALETCVLMPEKAALGRTVQDQNLLL